MPDKIKHPQKCNRNTFGPHLIYWLKLDIGKSLDTKIFVVAVMTFNLFSLTVPM